MKKVTVFFEEPNLEDYPFTNPKYKQSYCELAQIIQQKQGEFWIARSNETYLGQQKFSRGWRWNGVRFEKAGAFTASVIYDKRGDSRYRASFRDESNIKILNPNKIADICEDKLKTYELFTEFCPQTFLVKNEAELKIALEKIPSEKKVIKPRDMACGEGVQIDNIEKILVSKKKFPLLVQEFIDTSKGIPNLIDGIHDFRVILINGEIILSFIRTPPPNSLIANIAQGGSVHEVPLTKIPTNIHKITKKIDSQFTEFSRAYSIDFGFENNVPKLIEMNSQPAIFCREDGPDFVHHKKKLAEVLLSF